MGKRADDNNTNTDILEVQDVAALLCVSEATVRNWVKLGKLSCISRGPIKFSESDVKRLMTSLEDTGALSSRRNKSRQQSNFIPKSYISSSSPNFATIKALISDLSGKELSLWEVISYYAHRFLLGKGIPDEIANSLDLSQVSSSVSDYLKDYPLNFIDGEDTLGMLYISLRRLQDKKSTGSYYTPFFVVDELLKEIFAGMDRSVRTICDPACGTGNFLLRLPKDIPLVNVYGFDTDNNAIRITRINMVIKYHIISRNDLDILFDNIQTRDFLSNVVASNTRLQICSDEVRSPSRFRPQLQKFNLIVGNPPWGYSFSKSEAELLRNRFNCYDTVKNPESFSLFVEQAINCLERDGILSFLLPETILSADTHKGIRQYILDHSTIKSITYLGDVFYKVQCPSVILTLIKKEKNNSPYDCCVNISFMKCQKEALLKLKAFLADTPVISSDNLNILTDNSEQALIRKILSAPSFTLKDNADFALGIVTGSNRTLLKDAPGPGLEPILKGTDIEKFYHKEAGSYVLFDPDSFQQCAPPKMYRAKEKLFYRFIADEPIVALDCNKTLSLNSANIIIPRVPGYSCAYIMAILNSSVISFFYKKSFRNLKVLRSYLEQLPIATCSTKEQAKIAEMAMHLADLSKNPEAYEKQKAGLDRMIASLYGLSQQEYAQINS